MIRSKLTVALLVLLLAGCAAPALPFVPTPTPALTAQDYVDAYIAIGDGAAAIEKQFSAANFDSPEWRQQTIAIALDWRKDISAMQAMPVPPGENWAKAWPLLMDAFDGFKLYAGVVITAAEQNDPSLLVPVHEQSTTAINTLYEAMRILKGE